MGAIIRFRAEDCPQRASSALAVIRHLMGIVAALAAGGCTLSDLGDEIEPPGPPTIPLEQGITVAELEVILPQAETFTLRGTVPVPKAVYDPEDGVEPFGVVDADGETYGAQAEVTAWYPNDAADGASVVEVLARVSRGSQPAGQRARYRVVIAEHPAQPDPGAPGPEDLLAGPLSIPTVVTSLISSPTSIELRSYDCFGNLYRSYPLDGSGQEKLLRYGEHTAELRVFQHLMPSPPVGGAAKTLAHWLGAHAYVSTWNDEEIVGLDLRVSNADSGNDPTSSADDPLDKLYFKTFEVAVPSGWVVVQDYADPHFGPAYGSGGKTVFPIVDDLAGGKMHVIKWGGQFHRRLVLCRVGQEARARELLRGSGLGFARDVQTPELNKSWSWWHVGTARWWPQSHILPVFDHLGLSTVANGLISERNSLQAHLENGTSGGVYPVLAPVYGWAHPYGVAYGGMTGGAEINIFDGMRTAWAAEPAGYEKFRMLHRMHTDRMCNALYNLDGEPTTVEDWVKSSPEGAYVPFEHYVIPLTGGSDPFGLAAADKTHITHVAAVGAQPDYESSLLSYDPHDYQHFIRYTRSAKALTWLANDSVAKDDLRMQAENFKLSYHTYNNSGSGYKQATGMAWNIDYVAEHYASGFAVGRGEGWGLDCSSAAYATADRIWRAERRSWFDTFAQLIVDGQGQCNGFMQAVIHQKFLDSKYRARQAIEHAILDNAIRGMLETVYRGEDAAVQAMLESVLRDSYYALISPMSWGAGEPAPWQYAAVGPKDESLPVWCSFSAMPADGYSPGAYDNFQNWSDFAYGFEATGDLDFLAFAALQIGGASDLLGALQGAGLDNVENRAGLLALLQHQAGQF